MGANSNRSRAMGSAVSVMAGDYRPIIPSRRISMEERFLVTGALGCIGAWVVRNLVQAGAPVAVFDLASDPHRLRLMMSPEEVARVRFITGDITDLAAF